MPPSQLKTLKKSLRDQGIVGPQKSKKQKKQNAQSGLSQEKRVNRTEALNAIRDQFNPFEYKWSKGPKRDITTIKDTGPKGASIIGKPYVKKARAAENDVTQNMKNKVGGIVDRRFGENDPSMDPEQRMMERFAQETQRRVKKTAFDLEEDDGPEELTHMGRSLSLRGPNAKDDFNEEISGDEDEFSDGSLQESETLKRRRSMDEEESEREDEEEEGRPERKKSKQEVMKEVVAKSKLYKYERQAAKEDDDELREKLDKELPDIQALLQGIGRPKPQPPAKPALDVTGNPIMNADRLALLMGTEADLEKEYDMAHRKMAQDKRTVPTERTKTDEEKAEETATRLQELEAKRLRRMQGEPESSDDDGAADENLEQGGDHEDQEEDFGLGAGIKSRPTVADLGIEDEDDFLLDDDLVAESGSDLDIEFSDDESDEEDASKDEQNDEDGVDAEFLKGLLTKEESRNPKFLSVTNEPVIEEETPNKNGVNGDLPYTFKCPESHEELLNILKDIAISDLPIAVQRIRLQYDAKLKSDNRSKLGKFAVALVDHISYLANQPDPAPMAILETVIRHIHSMAKAAFPIEIANAFRRHLVEIRESRALSISAGDLVIFTAIGTIFPTSDHWHQVISPATLTMTRYLGLKIPQSLSDYSTGAFLSTQLLQYQRLSKRYIPEVMNFVENTLCVLAPTKLAKLPGHFPYHEPKISVRITNALAVSRKIRFSDCVSRDLPETEEDPLKLALLEANLKLVEAALDIWAEKPSAFEIFEPVLRITEHLSSKKCRSKLPETTQTAVTKLTQKLNIQLKKAEFARRPLELHHHKPLAIKLSIPKFEDSFNPEKHYDPDRERTEMAKLKKEHKRERKGAIRELRRDAKVVARDSLRDKKEKDAAYDKKYKRLVAEIQGEEGKESKAYEREKEWRKKGKK